MKLIVKISWSYMSNMWMCVCEYVCVRVCVCVCVCVAAFLRNCCSTQNKHVYEESVLETHLLRELLVVPVGTRLYVCGCIC